ncbi:MAG: hypothetical protein JXR77_00740 [Lentisphaeria bacterium]|nr:hypothetical protein [Lentisphaeria bacterium]
MQIVAPSAWGDAPPGKAWIDEIRLTVRESMDVHHGWLPLAWCYSGEEWN